MVNTVYHLQRNHKSRTPRTVVFLEVDTYYCNEGEYDWHYLMGAEIITHHYNEAGKLCQSESQSLSTTATTWQYISTISRRHRSILVVGSQITFALFSCDLPKQMEATGWKSQTLFASTNVCLMVAQRSKKTLRFANLTNWVDMPDTLPDKASERIIQTATAFSEYLQFVVKHDMGNFKYTIAAQALACYRHRFLTTEILHYDRPEFNKYIRAAYFGGRIEAGRIGRLPAGRYARLDVNSLYPFVMSANRYPTRFRQWLRNCNIDHAYKRAEDCCIIAQVLVSTSRPVYPYRRNGRTVYPTGQFRTYLGTESFRYAVEAGEVRAVEQLLVFEVGDLFSGFVGEFYPLKAQYNKDGMAVWRNTVKRLLNALYGKFAERHEYTLWEGDAPPDDLYSRPALVPAEAVPWSQDKFNWNHVAEKENGRLYVAATEHACLGRKWYTAGGKEADHSAPAISAHVTDYGRMALWRYIEKIGHENLIYCDTDSLIFDAVHLPKLEADIDEQRLGALRQVDEADYCEIRGAKDYTFGAQNIIAGKPANAVWENHRIYQCRYFPDPTRLLQPRHIDGAPIGTVSRSVASHYDKGDIKADGTVVPFFLEDGS